jgi:hypothetical protein
MCSITRPLHAIKALLAAGLFTLPLAFPASARGETRAVVELRGSAFGGASLLDAEGASFNAKTVANAGGALSCFYAKGGVLSYGGELAFQHSFRSDSEGYYYYDSFETISLIPMVELRLPRRAPSFTLTGGAGLAFALSSHMGREFFVASLGAGVRFRRSFVNGIQVQYTHGFLSDFTLFETLKAGVAFNLYREELEPVR